MIGMHRRSAHNSKKSNRLYVPVDLWLIVVKPFGAKWMVELYDHFKAKPVIIVNGFKGAGIVDYLASD